MLFRDNFVATLGVGFGLSLAHELFGERHVIEEGPRVVELSVPGTFKIAHRLKHTLKLLVTHESKQGGVDAGGALGAGFVAWTGTCKNALGLAGSCRHKLAEF